MSAEKCCSCGQKSSRIGSDGDMYCGKCIKEVEVAFRPKVRTNPKELCPCGSGIQYILCCMEKKKREKKWRTPSLKHAMLN